MKTELATFGAGCFWGVEETFRKLPGVTETAVGYMGGKTENPTYKQVCVGTTGHAEVLQITYDAEKIPYEDLLKTFWEIHNPTTIHQQGPDIGSQYRSVIFYHTPEQKELAEASKNKLSHSGKYDRNIVTEIVPAEPFYRAEEYHQRYFEKQGGGVCHI